MGLELPPWLPPPVMECVAGHYPRGDETSTRAAADYWSDVAEQCRAAAEYQDALAEKAETTVRGKAGDAAAQNHRDLAAKFRAQAECNDSLAEQLYESANSTELQKWTVIGFAVFLVWQFARAAVLFAFAPGVAVVEMQIDRAATQTALQIARQKFIELLAAQAAKSTAQRSTLVLAVKSGFWGAAQLGGLNIGLQIVQEFAGNRPKFDKQSALVSTLAGFFGGAAGGAAAKQFGELIVPKTVALAEGASSTAGRVAYQLGGTVVVAVSGGLVGGIAGAYTSIVASGQEVTLDAIGETLLPAVTGALLGGAAHGAADIRAGGRAPAVTAPSGVPRAARALAATALAGGTPAVAAPHVAPRPGPLTEALTNALAQHGILRGDPAEVHQQIDQLVALLRQPATDLVSRPASFAREDYNISIWKPKDPAAVFPDGVNQVRAEQIQQPGGEQLPANKAPQIQSVYAPDHGRALHTEVNTLGAAQPADPPVVSSAPRSPADNNVVGARQHPDEPAAQPIQHPGPGQGTAGPKPHPADHEPANAPTHVDERGPAHAEPGAPAAEPNAAPPVDSETPAAHPTAEPAGGPKPPSADHEPVNTGTHVDEQAAPPSAAQRQTPAPDDSAGAPQHVEPEAADGPRAHPAEADANSELPQPIPAASAVPAGAGHGEGAAAHPADAGPARTRSESPAGSPQRGQDRQVAAEAGRAPQTGSRATVSAKADATPPKLDVSVPHNQPKNPGAVSAFGPEKAGWAQKPAGWKANNSGPAPELNPIDAPLAVARDLPGSAKSSDGPAGPDAPAVVSEPVPKGPTGHSEGDAPPSEAGRSSTNRDTDGSSEHPVAPEARSDQHKPADETGSGQQPRTAEPEPPVDPANAADRAGKPGTEESTTPVDQSGEQPNGEHPTTQTPDEMRQIAEDILKDYAARSGPDIPEAQRLVNASNETLVEMLRGSPADATAALIEVIRRGEDKVLRWTQVAATISMRESIVNMDAGEGKSLVFMAHAARDAIEHGAVQVITTRDNLANREYIRYQQVLGALGFEIVRMNPDTAPPTPTPGKPTIYIGTQQDVGFAALRGNWVPGRRAAIDEIDEALVHAVTTYFLSEGAGKLASPEVAAQVNDAHNFLKIALEGVLDASDFGRTPEQRGGPANLTETGRQKLELQLGRELTPEQLSRLNLAAAAKWEYLENVHYVRHEIDGQERIFIIDQTTHKVMFDAETSTESRWNGGLAQAIEAKHGLAIRHDPNSSKSITAQRLFSQENYDKVTGASGTAHGSAGRLKELLGSDVTGIDRFKESQLKVMDDTISKDEAAKLQTIVADIKEMQKTGRPQLILCDRNDIVAELSSMVKVEHVAVDAKWFLEQGIHAEENLQQIFDAAGTKGKVLIINMQGARGVDIPIDVVTRELGGLHVAVTGRSALSRDIDIQAENRAARNGDPGSVRYYTSPTDNLYALTSNPLVRQDVIKYVNEYTQAAAEHQAAPSANTRARLNRAESDLRALVEPLQEAAATKHQQLAAPADHTSGPNTRAPPPDQTDDDKRTKHPPPINQLPQTSSGGALSAATAGQQEPLSGKVDKWQTDDTHTLLQQAQGAIRPRHKRCGNDWVPRPSSTYSPRWVGIPRTVQQQRRCSSWRTRSTRLGSVLRSTTDGKSRRTANSATGWARSNEMCCGTPSVTWSTPRSNTSPTHKTRCGKATSSPNPSSPRIAV